MKTIACASGDRWKETNWIREKLNKEEGRKIKGKKKGVEIT
jgi:hypothetical protein